MVMPSTNGGDSFISDDEEELCPLCVEEMDISDKNFKPCPCGYQVCQFCYNNIRQNPQLNGKCPACRRPYTDDAVEYRKVSTEEWKQDQQRQVRKEKERKQRERERKETDLVSKNKQHLSGIRVIQKNLVYVIGLNPNIPTDELHNTLRGDQFFGQYGKIQKIVINRRTNANGHPGIGVYVTFARKEDALRCIQAVDGSMNEGKYLRAAFGTTKYCSAYLRGQQCPNPNCMFLHEPGDDADSVSRQDLSTIQHAARGGSGATKAGGSGRQQAQSQASNRSDDDTKSVEPVPTPLPTTTAWGKASPPSAHQRLATSSPKVQKEKEKEKDAYSPEPVQPQTDPTLSLFNDCLMQLAKGTFEYRFSSALLSESDLRNSATMPPFFAFSQDQTKDGRDLPNFETVFAGLSSGRQYQQTSSSVAATTPLQVPSGILGPNGDFINQANPTKTATPPPPGLFAQQQQRNTPSPNASTQDRQVLLAQLMNGGKDSIQLHLEMFVKDVEKKANWVVPAVEDLVDIGTDNWGLPASDSDAEINRGGSDASSPHPSSPSTPTPIRPKPELVPMITPIPRLALDPIDQIFLPIPSPMPFGVPNILPNGPSGLAARGPFGQPGQLEHAGPPPGLNNGPPTAPPGLGPPVMTNDVTPLGLLQTPKAGNELLDANNKNASDLANDDLSVGRFIPDSVPDTPQTPAESVTSVESTPARSKMSKRKLRKLEQKQLREASQSAFSGGVPIFGASYGRSQSDRPIENEEQSSKAKVERNDQDEAAEALTVTPSVIEREEPPADEASPAINAADSIEAAEASSKQSPQAVDSDKPESLEADKAAAADAAELFGKSELSSKLGPKVEAARLEAEAQFRALEKDPKIWDGLKAEETKLLTEQYMLETAVELKLKALNEELGQLKELNMELLVLKRELEESALFEKEKRERVKKAAKAKRAAEIKMVLQAEAHVRAEREAAEVRKAAELAAKRAEAKRLAEEKKAQETAKRAEEKRLAKLEVKRAKIREIERELADIRLSMDQTAQSHRDVTTKLASLSRGRATDSIEAATGLKSRLDSVKESITRVRQLQKKSMELHALRLWQHPQTVDFDSRPRWLDQGMMFSGLSTAVPLSETAGFWLTKRAASRYLSTRFDSSVLAGIDSNDLYMAMAVRSAHHILKGPVNFDHIPKHQLVELMSNVKYRFGEKHRAEDGEGSDDSVNSPTSTPQSREVLHGLLDFAKNVKTIELRSPRFEVFESVMNQFAADGKTNCLFKDLSEQTFTFTEDEIDEAMELHPEPEMTELEGTVGKRATPPGSDAADGPEYVTTSAELPSGNRPRLARPVFEFDDGGQLDHFGFSTIKKVALGSYSNH